MSNYSQVRGNEQTAILVKGGKEEAGTLDATSGGTVTVDLENGNVQVITADDTDFTIAMNNLPSGSSASITLLIKFTSTIPTITWPSLENDDPDVSAATATTGKALVELFWADSGLWAFVVGTV